MNDSFSDIRYDLHYTSTTLQPSSSRRLHIVNEQPNALPSSSQELQSTPYYAHDSMPSSTPVNSIDYHPPIGNLGHHHPQLNLDDPYGHITSEDVWSHNDSSGGVSSGLLVEDQSTPYMRGGEADSANQAKQPNWSYPYHIYRDYSGQEASSSLYSAQPPPAQWTEPSTRPQYHVESHSFPTIHSSQDASGNWIYPTSVSASHQIAHSPVDTYSVNQNAVQDITSPTNSYVQGHTSSPPNELSPSSVPVAYTQHSPAQGTNPFFQFPNGDPSRNLTYHENSDYDRQTNTELLGLPASNMHDQHGGIHLHHVPTTFSANISSHSPPHQLVVPTQRSIPAPEIQSEHDAKKFATFEQGLPHDRNLQLFAFSLSKEEWLVSDESEPPLDNEETPSHTQGNPSRFDRFIQQRGNTHTCVWLVKGEPCTHDAPRKERAQGHARSHFDYSPFHCGGKCGSEECTHKYHCQSALNDHVRRKGKPEKPCEICGRSISVQNMQRHKKTHKKTDKPPKRSRVKQMIQAISSVGRAIKRSLSPSPAPSRRSTS